ncbi:MAG TPA: outer membrane beta-barrel protein [Steroidobacteraceae bacterium]|jgi:hypothetical protein
MRKCLLLAALVFAGAAAQAADGVYVGASIGKSNLNDIYASGFNLDPDPVSWKIIAGFRPIDFFSVEANYIDIGSEHKPFGIGTADADAKAFAAYAVGFLPIPYFDVFGKAGLARWQLRGDFSSNSQLFGFDDHGTQFAYGAGAQANWGPFSARFEYDGFRMRNTDGLSMYSIGAIWTFL